MDKTVIPSADRGLSTYTVSFGLSLAITSVASALLVIAKEERPALMMSMQSATGHHWATHSLFALVLFLAVGFGLARTNDGQGPTISSAALAKLFVGGIALGALLIGGFYLCAG